MEVHGSFSTTTVTLTMRGRRRWTSSTGDSFPVCGKSESPPGNPVLSARIRRVKYAYHMLCTGDIRMMIVQHTPRMFQVIQFRCGPCYDEDKVMGYGEKILEEMEHRMQDCDMYPYMHYKTDKMSEEPTTGGSLYKICYEDD